MFHSNKVLINSYLISSRLEIFLFFFGLAPCFSGIRSSWPFTQNKGGVIHPRLQTVCGFILNTQCFLENKVVAACRYMLFQSTVSRSIEAFKSDLISLWEVSTALVRQSLSRPGGSSFPQSWGEAEHAGGTAGRLLKKDVMPNVVIQSRSRDL